MLVQSRQSFGADRDVFKGETRETLKRMIRGIVDCEVSVELIKQKIYSKLRV